MARCSPSKCRGQGSPNSSSFKNNKHHLRNRSTDESPRKAAFDSSHPLPKRDFPEVLRVGLKDKYAGFNDKVKESLRHSYAMNYPSFPKCLDSPVIHAGVDPSPTVSEAPEGSAVKMLFDGQHNDTELQDSIDAQQKRVQIKRLLLGAFLGILIFSLLWWWWLPKSNWRAFGDQDEVNLEKIRRRMKRQTCWFNIPCQYDCKEDEWTSSDTSRKYAKLHRP